MTLYHGTNADFERISLTIGLRYKDLDQQYYFGTEHAVRFLRKTNVETV